MVDVSDHHEDAALPAALDHWAARIRQGDVRAIARAISAVENAEPHAAELLRQLSSGAGHAVRIGITGAAGAGKSTLSDALVAALRQRGRRVGVLAVDPSSPITGGALLGDRVRMQAHGLDPGVYIRSMATRGAAGGISRATREAAAVLDAAGMDFILMETVGIGQDEVAVARVADMTLLLLTPGSGDGVQALKAGVMEIADIFVLNKADLPGSERLEAQIYETLHLAAEPSADQAPRLPAVIKTVATEGRGVEQLLDAITALAGQRQQRGSGKRPRELYASPRATGGAPQLEHLGVAVHSLAESVKFYEAALGFRVSGYEHIAHEQTRVALLPAGDSRIELLEPTQSNSPIGRFLARRGPGLHHLCLRVPDLRAAMERLERAGAKLVQQEPGIGAGGHRYVFIHPASAGGVLLELVESASEESGKDD